MNIFATSHCPIQSARWLCNKHIVKQGLESCQLLANCFTKQHLADPSCPRNQSGAPRGHFNPKHPSCFFTTATRANMRWVIAHAQEIFNEHYRRYPLKRHFSHDFLDWVIANQGQSIVPEGELTDFTVAISQDKWCRQIKGFGNLPVVDKYKLYIVCDKPFAKWPIGETPPWIQTLSPLYHQLLKSHEETLIQAW